MKIRRYNVLSYAVSADCELRAKAEFENRKVLLSKKSNTEVSCTVRKFYLPLLKVPADMMPWHGIGGVSTSNNFFVGLNDGNIYYMHTPKLGEKAKSLLNREEFKWPLVDKIDLLSLAKLSPNAISMMGDLSKVGRTKYESLDVNARKGVEELASQGYARIYVPGEDDPFFTSLAQGMVDMMLGVHRSAYYAKSLVKIPPHQSRVYNLSLFFSESDVFDGEYAPVKVHHTPEKLTYLLSLLFNARVALHEILYMPVMEGAYHYLGKDEFKLRVVAAMKGIHSVKKYPNPCRHEPLMLGTAGHGLTSTPLESGAIKFSDVAGMEQVKEELNKAIVYPLVRPDLSREFRQKAGGGILLYGPPGCGKTFIMRATVGEAGVNLFTVDIQDVIGQNPEAGTEKVHEIFKEARENSPSILFFDEIDALGGSRTMQTHAARFIVNQLLTEMNGIEESNENVLIVGATNAPWDVDPALRRAGRFTTKVLIPPPDLNSRLALFLMYSKKVPVSGDVDMKKLAEMTEYYSSSDIAAVCDKAAEIPWSESMKGMPKRPLSMNDFLNVLGGWSTSLAPWFALAEKELRSSGETDLYPGLNTVIDEFRRKSGKRMA